MSSGRHRTSFDSNVTVGASNLIALLANWGPCDDCELPGDRPADLNGDCTVGAGDVLLLLGNWG